MGGTRTRSSHPIVGGSPPRRGARSTPKSGITHSLRPSARECMMTDLNLQGISNPVAHHGRPALVWVLASCDAHAWMACLSSTEIYETSPDSLLSDEWKLTTPFFCALSGRRSAGCCSRAKRCLSMLVPKFTISQDDKEVRIRIRLPFVRVGDAEVHVVSANASSSKAGYLGRFSALNSGSLVAAEQDGRDFSFYCKPYLLKLCFPHELRHSEDEGSYRAVYDADMVRTTGAYLW